MKHLAFIAVLLCFSCTPKGDHELTVKKGDITESVYASGLIRSTGQYTVYATTSGTLKATKVIVGQPISKGQVLFELDADKARLTEENARLVYQLSQDNGRYIRDKIAEMELKVQAAADKLAVDESVYNRNKRIREYKVISEVDYERVELAYKSSKAAYQTALSQLSQLKEQLKNEQIRNRNNYNISKETAGDYAVKSAFSGRLFDIMVKDGTLITPQTPLAIVGETNSYFLELEVDENDMARVEVGQKALVTMDSYRNQVFEAIVDKIYPIMDERSRTFRIEAHFLNEPKKLYPNLTAEANIIISSRKNTVVIPKSYLLPGDSVCLANGKKKKVKLGLTDYQKAEIVSGLQSGERIAQPAE